jgi:glycosyltransferase involved in cell wall biosynthesis
MKILQISPQFPYPLDSGGRIGIFNIVKQLSAFGAEVFFVAFTKTKVPNEFVEYFRSFCHPFVIHLDTRNTFPRLLKYFLLNKPVLTEKFYCPKAKNSLQNIIKNIDFDLIHLDHTNTFSIGKWLSEKTGKPLGLRLHNIEWVLWERLLKEQVPLSPQWLFLKQQTRLLREKERQAIATAKVSFTCTDYDRSLALELVPNANVLVASPGVDLSLFRPDPKVERNPKEIIIVSTFDWLPNISGLKWFLEKVLPLIVEKMPDAFVLIIGKNPPDFFRDYKNVNVLGYVEDIKPYYNRGNILVVPLFVGSGVRIKILEAMAMELPVVSTSIGAEGIPIAPDSGILIANEPEQFANSVIELLNKPEKARQLGSNARNFVQKHFSVESSIAIMFNEYKRIIEESSKSSGKDK